nr:citrate transporter [Lachnospiraceae bacterium]
KKQPVLVIASAAMLVTCFFVKPDKEYIGYFNGRTLATLFCTLAVVAAFSHIHTFEIVSRAIIIKLHSLRNVFFAVVFITFFGSMLLANDMALLTFLPLGFFVLNSTGHKKEMALLFIMQNIAANLGGMVTPFGNPQNLYLYAYYNIPTPEFVHIMLPPFIVSTLLIVLICLFVKNEPLKLLREEDYAFNRPRTLEYSALFIFSLLIVFRLVPYTWGTLIVVLALLFLDKKALLEVNYPLLLTFCVFFVFSGNMARIPAVNAFLGSLLPKNTLLFGLLSCQVISNVPSAVLLSHFTDNYSALLPAVNIGGLGTLIASLASLITFTNFKKFNPEKTGSYVALFTAINFGFLLVLYISEKICISL